MTENAWHDDTWSGDWWKRHWLGMLGIALLAFWIGWEKGGQQSEAALRARVAAEYPSVARDMARADAERDSLESLQAPDADLQWDQYRGR